MSKSMKETVNMFHSGTNDVNQSNRDFISKLGSCVEQERSKIEMQTLY